MVLNWLFGKNENSLDTIKYHLESKPGVSVEILEKYFTIANQLTYDLINKTNPDLFEVYPILNEDSKILRSTLVLAQFKSEHEKHPLLKDQIYLNVAIYGAKQEKAPKMKKNLEVVLDSLSTSN